MSLPYRRLLALLGAAVLAACGSSSSPGSTTPKGGLAAEVASYDLAIGPPTRLLVGVFAADQRPVGYGTVTMRFCYLGTGKSNTATAAFGVADRHVIRDVGDPAWPTANLTVTTTIAAALAAHRPAVVVFATPV